ncbi:MAG TPA: serine/threonine-protein kinase [Anaerolineales bacterium]|nr:serine/threonine-protein kinase [Anaerolineales bacterium]
MRNNSPIGRTLGSFKIDRLIGRGGMADVYHGMDIKLHRPVAVKIFDSQSRTNASQSNRFLQEARMMAQWRHPNIVQIYSSGDATGLLYYVMEYIDGYDLASIMQIYAEKGELMPFADVLRIGDAIASALDYAHEQGVIHRDVKPANVMIANDGRVVLGDFGLALDIRDKSRGEVFGSPHYISPEQARRSSDAVPQSDLYSLGVILYEILTGSTPFNDPSPASLALQHITETPPLPRAINPALSVEVEAVLLKALEKKPGDRYPSGRSLMDALRGTLIVKPVTKPRGAPPLPPIPVGAPPVQRSDISLNSFTKRRDVATELQRRSTISRTDLAEPLLPRPTLRLSRASLFMIVLAVLLVLGYPYYPNLLLPLTGRQARTATLPIITVETISLETQTQVVNIQPPASPTLTATAIPSVTLSPTGTQPPTPTVTETATTAVTATQTVPYPNGHLMTAFYNESSFYLLDRGKASRSVAGFTFERVNQDGTFQNLFDGWEWEKLFKVIQPTRCLSLELDPTPAPYLVPAECKKRILSYVRLAPASSTIFWTPNENSLEFRVMWLDEEIARCKIEAGTCDFYVP